MRCLTRTQRTLNKLLLLVFLLIVAAVTLWDVAHGRPLWAMLAVNLLVYGFALGVALGVRLFGDVVAPITCACPQCKPPK